MQTKSNAPKLNPTQLYLVARALDCSMKEFYENPINRERFEEWKTNKGGKQNEVKTDSHSEE